VFPVSYELDFYIPEGSETSVLTRTMSCNIPEDGIVQNVVSEDTREEFRELTGTPI
jgi:hypothetical protein